MNNAPEAFAWDLAVGLPLIIQDGTTSYITGHNGLPLEQINASGSSVFYHQDQLGSTRALTDGTGAVLGTYSYDPYGKVTSLTGSVTTPFQFAGSCADAESSLLYLRARYYDPASATFLTRDPNLSPNTYAAGAPTNYVDPSGLAPSRVPSVLGQGLYMGRGIFNDIEFGSAEALNRGDCLGAVTSLARPSTAPV